MSETGRRAWQWPTLAFAVLVCAPLGYLLVVIRSGEPLESVVLVVPGVAGIVQEDGKRWVSTAVERVEIPPEASPLVGTLEVKGLWKAYQYDLALYGPDGATVWAASGWSPGSDDDGPDDRLQFPTFDAPAGSYRLESRFTWYEKEVPEVVLHFRRNVTPVNYAVLLGLAALALVGTVVVLFVARRRGARSSWTTVNG